MDKLEKKREIVIYMYKVYQLNVDVLSGVAFERHEIRRQNDE